MLKSRSSTTEARPSTNTSTRHVNLKDPNLTRISTTRTVKLRVLVTENGIKNLWSHNAAKEEDPVSAKIPESTSLLHYGPTMLRQIQLLLYESTR